LQELGDNICKALDRSYRVFNNIILSVYEEGFHLEPHIDINSTDHQTNFYFQEEVFGIIIEPDPTGHLYFIQDSINTIPSMENQNIIYHLNEKKGTTFSLEGDYRKSPYFHGVTHVSKRRISITFRVVCFK
jgi:hypothetical protein